MDSLQKALLANAIFSSISGVFGLLFHSWLAGLFHLNSGRTFWIIGIVLLFFAMSIVLEFYKKRYWPIVWIIIQDTIWVMGSLLLVVFQPFGISVAGNYVIGSIALIVAFMAVSQAKALREVPKP